MKGSRVLATLADTFWVLVLAILVLFAFFVALGALSLTEVVGLTLAMGALALLWIAHAMWDARHRSGRDVATIRARERRGF
jgi:membrane protein YdbS with pleckstrin-like domain